MTLTIACEPPRQSDVTRLLELSNVYMAALYPAESNHLVDLDALEKPGVSFFVAREDGHAIGCCALVEAGDGTAEIKRLFVTVEARGLSLGKRLMAEVEARARQSGLVAIRLETGIHQPEAIGLYRRLGFGEIPAFAPYKEDPLSLFMEKRL